SEHVSLEGVLDDPGVTAADAAAVKRVVFASGKVAYDALDARDKLGAPVAIARVEQLFPCPFAGVRAVLERYPNAAQIFWLQEEPENMGPWNAIKGRLYEAHGTTHWIHRGSRSASGSPA